MENIFTIQEDKTVSVNKHTKSFTFKLGHGDKLHSKTGLQIFYSDLSFFGKHYTLVPYQGDQPVRFDQRTLRRHYTIANCMRQDFYKELIARLESTFQSSSTFPIDLLSQQDS